MIFAHRGLVTKNSPQNSISSLKAAYEGGFKGVEFDLWFVDGEILIKHDHPQKEEKLPNLRDYFCFKNQLSYWLDFKNLDRANVKKVFELTRLEVDAAGIDHQKIFLIPFETNYELAAYFYDVAKEVFGEEVNFGAVCEERERIGELERFCNIKGPHFLSIFHELIDENFLKTFPHQQIFAWTIKDKSIFNKLQKLGIKNFASD